VTGYPEVKSVSLQGGIREGSVFRWKTNSGKITSTFQPIEPPHHVAWTGKTLSIKAIHSWTLEQTNGKTTVKTAESFETQRLPSHPLVNLGRQGEALGSWPPAARHDTAR
jgi:hypothetical protein